MELRIEQQVLLNRFATCRALPPDSAVFGRRHRGLHAMCTSHILNWGSLGHSCCPPLSHNLAVGAPMRHGPCRIALRQMSLGCYVGRLTVFFLSCCVACMVMIAYWKASNHSQRSHTWQHCMRRPAGPSQPSFLVSGMALIMCSQGPPARSPATYHYQPRETHHRSIAGVNRLVSHSPLLSCCSAACSAVAQCHREMQYSCSQHRNPKS
jgi:hypothetical protein